MAYVRVDFMYIGVYNCDMKKLTVGAFRRELKRWLDLLEGGGEIEVRGIKIGKISEKSAKSHVHLDVGGEASGDMGYVEADNGSVQDWPENEDGIKREACQLCGGVGDWVFWEDGEERVVCDSCIRKRCNGEKMYKMMVRGYNKIV